ncbi:MAG: MBL fold metallo-hydrolase [Phycisphaerae bacterium]|nr:MBL fold metallo-hydrolase [Phycisphaerae bacterium]
MNRERTTLQIETFVEAMFGENSFVISARDGGSCWIIDPSFPPQCQEATAYIAERGLALAAIVLTHGHADHIAGIEHVLHDWPEAPIWIGAEDDIMLTDARANLSAPFGISLVMPKSAEAHLDPGQTLELDGTRWQVLDTSGHSPGGRSLYCAEAGVVFVGDALFAGSIGRVDLPGSDGDQLLGNIRRNLYTLPDETVVYTGHGPTTTIGVEKTSNPFVRA